MCLHCHVVSIGVEIKNLDALASACERLGWTFTHGEAGYRWFGRWVDDSPVPQRLFANEHAYLGVVHMTLAERQDHMTKLLAHPHAYLQVPGHDYHVGVYAVGDHYELLFDEWHGSFAQSERHAIAQTYAVEQCLSTARARGDFVTVHATEDAAVEVRIQIQE